MMKSVNSEVGAGYARRSVHRVRSIRSFPISLHFWTETTPTRRAFWRESPGPRSARPKSGGPGGNTTTSHPRSRGLSRDGCSAASDLTLPPMPRTSRFPHPCISRNGATVRSPWGNREHGRASADRPASGRATPQRRSTGDGPTATRTSPRP
jgi:hypothetical protein